MMASLFSHLECSACVRRADAGGLATICPACGAPLVARYAAGGPPPAGTATAVPPRDLGSRPHSLWRFPELLPPLAPADRVTLGEGATPMLRIAALEAAVSHAPIYIKEEGLNPTLSFKARGMAVAVSMARARGATRLAVPSAGNAGGALAAYAARAELPALVVLPEDTPGAFAAEARRHGALVELVPGTIGDAARRIAERAAEGWFDLSTFKEPYRLEGKKTLGFEIVEDLGFRYPDWIIYPTGGGTGLVGMWKAFAEMEALGWLAGRRPRMIAVQADGCAPIVAAFASGAERATPPANPHTAAYGLRVPKPFADRLILAALRESDGDAIAVSEAAIASGAGDLARLAGMDAGPEGAAAWAGARALIANGRIRRDDVVVVVNTGAGIKYR